MTDKLTALRDAIENVHDDLNARTPFKVMVGLLAVSTMRALKVQYEHDNSPLQRDIAAYALAKRFETEFKGIKDTSLKRILDNDEGLCVTIEQSVQNARDTWAGIDQFKLIDAPDMSLTLQVRAPSNRTDNKKFIAELRKRGVDEAIIDGASAAATTQSAPAKLFDVIQE